mgnify:CR=1 FL=1
MKKALILVLMTFGFTFLQAQIKERMGRISIDGMILPVLYTETDTIILAEEGYLAPVEVIAPPQFSNYRDRRLYYKYRRYATIVYPYAVDAISIFRKLEETTEEMNRRKKRLVVNKLKDELKDEFKDPLKSLTKTQGRILVDMIERELDTNLYDLLKEWNGGISARFWQTVGSFNDYDLKQGYIKGKDPILDMVLDDFEIRYGYEKDE